MKYLLVIAMSALSCSLAAQELTLQSSGSDLIISANGITAMTALQFNLELPDGVTITDTGVTMGDATDGHTLCMETLDNGDLLVILYSMDLNTFKDGELLRIPLTANNSNARLYNIRLADTSAKSYSAESATTSTTIVGDANANGEVEIGDVTSVLTLMATPEANGYDNKAADANGNGEIEIGDVTTILTIMANGGYPEDWILTVRDQDNNYVVPAEGGTKTVVLTTTRDVELSCSESWAHLGTMSYNVLENGKIYELYPEITFDANTTGEVRSATIYFDNGTDNRLSLIYTQERVRYDVVPPTWKGFDYKVKKGGTGEDTERGEIGPGDKVRVYCVRKSNGVLTGRIKGTITLKWTTQAEGPSVVTEMTEEVITPVNPDYDGWLLYSYADFNIPDGGPYDFCKAEVTCNLNFECFGNAVRWEDHTSHMDPYIGSIYTTNCNATKGSACTTENVLLWKSN